MTVDPITPIQPQKTGAFHKLKLMGADLKKAVRGKTDRLKTGGENFKKDLAVIKGGAKSLAGEIGKIDWRKGARTMGREFKKQLGESGRGMRESGKAFKQIFYTEMKDYLKECSTGEAVAAGFFTGALFGSLPTVLLCSLTGGPLGFAALGAAMAAPVVYNGAYRLNRYWKNLGAENPKAG